MSTENRKSRVGWARRSCPRVAWARWAHKACPPYGASAKHCQGFSLLELILVIVIVSIAAVPLMNGFMSMGGWLVTPIESVPVGAQLAQECAEHIMTLRRKNNYAGVSGTSCNGLPALPAGYSRTVTVTNRTSATLAACPAATNCKEVAIAVSKGGTTVGRASLMLVEY